MALPTALALAPALVQSVNAFTQSRRANRLEKNEFVPPSLDRSINIAESRASKSVAPGYNRAVETLNQVTANTVDNAKRASTNAAAVQQMVSASDINAKKNIADLQAANEEFSDRSALQLQDRLVQRGEFEQYNEDQYQAARSALRGAAQQNTFNAITNAAEVGILASGGNAFEGMSDSQVKAELSRRQKGNSSLSQEEIAFLNSRGLLSKPTLSTPKLAF